MSTYTDARTSPSLARTMLNKVPEVTAFFWVIKALSTAMGESTSDYMVHVMNPVAAVGIGFIGFVIALALQFSRRRYLAWTYWFAVVMVGVFASACHASGDAAVITIDTSHFSAERSAGNPISASAPASANSARKRCAKSPRPST